MFFCKTLVTSTILFLFILNGSSASLEPEVQVQEGKLRGKHRTTKKQRTFVTFEGIPYAEPPLKELRFLPPVPAKPWEGIRNATEVHNVCPQRDIYRRATLIEGDEDCLYLNVYTPQLKSDGGSSLPVMVFFHGGGFLCGGGNSLWYGPDVLMDRDVVLVVPNYRLGALGFLSTGDKVQPGNNGLKDQNLAIRWVKNNIAKFGGDPKLITLFGESAGGASVQFHMLSPLSRGLFNSGISQSGTAHCLWSLSAANQAIENGKKLAKALNCTTESSIKMVECLRDVPAYDIIAQDELFMTWDTDPMIPFKPVIEPKHVGAFLTQHPIDALESGNFADVPWMTGLTTEDGALRVAGLYTNPHLLEDLDKRFNEIVPASLEYDQSNAKDIDFISKKIRDFYFDERPIDRNVVEELTNMYTDGWFLHGADEAVRYLLKFHKQPVYYYLFAHRGAASFTRIFGDKDRDYGVCHADDLQYLFPIGDGLFPDIPPTNSDKNMTEIMTSLWVNFARTGNPTPDDALPISEKWTRVESEDMEYYHIDSINSHMKSGLLLERAKFWRKLPIHERVNEIKDEL